ncbi:hypothetical protein [Embleya hyalina]|uniref:Uncharacterized protein n=1 Tax=Embleya hyalina TaxID=516124 RepID=A0A401Z3X6_9ACTN|nr:hypothetical protein [Embleya hyalina]GCE01552.1 hypothetical protein EHYA_09318 [Embleya hyalina]
MNRYPKVSTTALADRALALPLTPNTDAERRDAVACVRRRLAYPPDRLLVFAALGLDDVEEGERG